MKLAFVGLGNMGLPMAKNLVQAGYEVYGLNRSKGKEEAFAAAGGKVGLALQELASHVDVIMTCLPMPADVEQVYLGPDGLVQHGRSGLILIDFSTVCPELGRRIADAAKEAGMEFLDAPVSGGVAGAAKGTLAVMVSCARATYDELQEMLAGLGKPFYVGPEAGQGQVVKLANNLMSMAALAITSEAMVMGAKAGVDPALMLDVINVSSGRNTASMEKFPRAVLPGTFDFGFATGLAYKDVKLCVDEAESLGVPMVVGGAVRELYAVTQATQGAASDFTSVCRVVEAWAGTEVRARKG